MKVTMNAAQFKTFTRFYANCRSVFGDYADFEVEIEPRKITCKVVNTSQDKDDSLIVSKSLSLLLKEEIFQYSLNGEEPIPTPKPVEPVRKSNVVIPISRGDKG
jgi:hypothetical protein